MKNIKDIVVIVSISVFIVGLTFASLLIPDKDISESERRNLKQIPELSLSSVMSGKYMNNFEEYTLDQFPAREEFRRLKAFTAFSVMQKKDNNNIYIADGYVSKIDYPLNLDSVNYAAERFRYVYNKYISDNNCSVYFSVVPDKNFFLADKYGYPHIDYSELTATFIEKMDFASYIDIFPTLDIDDYYKTDTHWRQEMIYNTARVICEGMNVPYADYDEYKICESDYGFYGVYYGQVALSLNSEKFCYAESPLFDSISVFDYEKNTDIPMVDKNKLKETDQYEAFLGGSSALITITNENYATDRELVIFRDSFGSSISSYFAAGYRKIYLADIRYIQPERIGNFIDFKDKDVLFLYSTSVLNNSKTIK